MSKDAIAALAHSAALFALRQMEKQAGPRMPSPGMLQRFGSMADKAVRGAFSRPRMGRAGKPLASGARQFSLGRTAGTLGAAGLGAGMVGGFMGDQNTAEGNLGWQQQKALGSAGAGEAMNAWLNPMNTGKTMASMIGGWGQSPDRLRSAQTSGWSNGPNQATQTAQMMDSPAARWRRAMAAYNGPGGGQGAPGGGGHGAPGGGGGGHAVPDDPVSTHSYYVNYGLRRPY